MCLRIFRRVGAILGACLVLGVLCGFALPVPEDWLARDPDFSLTRPVPGDGPEEETVTVVPLPEDEDLGSSVVEPEPLPEGPLVAVFLT